MTLPSNARTGSSSLALLTAVACCTMGIEGRAQAPADAPPSKLTYSVKVGFFSPKLDYTRSVTPAGLQLYSGRIPYL